MVFHTNKRIVRYPKLKVNNNNIERVTEFNFLGTILHSHNRGINTLWRSVVKENHSLDLLQKKALRIIANSDYLTLTKPICKKLRILKISDMFSVAMWKSIIN